MCSKSKFRLAFSLPEALLVTALVGLLTVMIAQLSAQAYPAQARHRASMERTRSADGFLDALVKQSQVSRAVLQLDTADTPGDNEQSLADVPLVVAWNGRGSTLFDVYRFHPVDHTVVRTRYKDNFNFAHPASSTLDDGCTADGEVVARDVASLTMQGSRQNGVQLLHLRMRVTDRARLLMATVTIP